MDDLDPDTVRRRAFAALEGVADIEAQLQARLRANKDGRLLGEAWSRPPQPRQPVHPPIRRPERAGRDWLAEKEFFGSGAEIAALRGELSEAVGIVFSEERATVTQQLDQLRAELRLEFKTALAEALTGILTAIAVSAETEHKAYERLARGIDQIERLLMHLNHADSTEGFGLGQRH